MRRRRQKNTLLPKMLGLAVLINAILLPILAQFGAFKSITGQRLTPVELVKAPPPEKRPPAPRKTPKKQAAKPHAAARKAASRPAAAVRRVPSGPPPVKVVAAGPAAGGGSGGGDSEITNADSNPPSPLTPPAPDAGGNGTTAPPAPPVTLPPPPAPTPPAPAPVTPPPSPPAPHVPALTAAVPLDQPRPTIPDDLQDRDLSATFEGLFTIHADGTATVKMVSSTGNLTLDARALEAARRWRFRPATRDAQPIESYLRVKIEFEVSS